MKIKLIFLGCLVAISTSLWASDAGEFRGETKAKIEILQKQNDQTNSKIDSLEKDIRDEYKTVTDRQNERIGDIESHFNIFLTILGILAALAGYMTFKRSKELALNEVKDWLEKNGDSIKTNMTKFEKELEMLKEQAKDATNEHNKQLVSTQQQAENELQKLQQTIQDGKEKTKEFEKLNNSDALGTIAQLLSEKPQNEYSFDDWNRLAFDAYKNDKKEDALFYWRKAIEISEPMSKQKSQTLFNIAVTLGQLKRNEEEIAVYDELTQELEGTQNEILLEQKIKALNNKGAILTDLNRNEEAIVVSDIISQELKGTEIVLLQQERAKAMVNKGVALSQLNRYEEAIEIFDEIINELRVSNNQILKEKKAKAFINRLELSLIMGKEIVETSDETIKQNINENTHRKLKFLMLQTLYKSLKYDQNKYISKLKKEFPDFKFTRWSWTVLDNWANNLENLEAKARVLATIEQFKNW